MSERHATCEPYLSRWKRLAHISEQKKFCRWNAVRMSRDGPLAHVNLAGGEKVTKVIVSSTVAEPQFQQISVEFTNQVGSQVEAGALSLKPSYKTIEPAHRGDYAAIPAVSRNRLISATAVLSCLFVDSSR